MTTISRARDSWRRRCAALVVRAHGVAQGGRERGDVPGWVLITLMTAGLVTALWAVAGPQLNSLFTNALASVQGP